MNRHRPLFRAFSPDFLFDELEAISPQFLAAHDIKWLAVDLDNTLTLPDSDIIADDAAEWIAVMREAGVPLAVISNNNPQRVASFSEKSGLLCISEAAKPSRKGLLAASKALNLPVSEGAMVGDQIFTDVWAARSAKMLMLLVPPIVEEKEGFLAFKRRAERLVKAGRVRRRTRSAAVRKDETAGKENNE